jgi:bis(5'-nucleosyl)-tetraphosphatase (symmetrical)
MPAMDYLVGDVQGCLEPLEQLMAEVQFSPSRDRLVLLGDLVNRGPNSLGVLRLVRGLDNAAQALLGNHDLHLLAVAHGARKLKKGDTFADVLDAPDRDAWIDWLRQRPLALVCGGWLCVHAGVAPVWTAAQTLRIAGELHELLRSENLAAFLPQMYGNQPDAWQDDLQGAARWRCAINIFTRIRFCHADGRMDFDVKEGAAQAPTHLLPWFALPERRSAGERIAFGHWSTLGLTVTPLLLGLDTGCVWGGRLTAACVREGQAPEIFSVPSSVRVPIV